MSSSHESEAYYRPGREREEGAGVLKRHGASEEEIQAFLHPEHNVPIGDEWVMPKIEFPSVVEGDWPVPSPEMFGTDDGELPSVH